MPPPTTFVNQDPSCTSPPHTLANPDLSTRIKRHLHCQAGIQARQLDDRIWDVWQARVKGLDDDRKALSIRPDLHRHRGVWHESHQCCFWLFSLANSIIANVKRQTLLARFFCRAATEEPRLCNEPAGPAASLAWQVSRLAWLAGQVSSLGSL